MSASRHCQLSMSLHQSGLAALWSLGRRVFAKTTVKVASAFKTLCASSTSSKSHCSARGSEQLLSGHGTLLASTATESCTGFSSTTNFPFYRWCSANRTGISWILSAMPFARRRGLCLVGLTALSRSRAATTGPHCGPRASTLALGSRPKVSSSPSSFVGGLRRSRRMLRCPHNPYAQARRTKTSSQ